MLIGLWLLWLKVGPLVTALPLRTLFYQVGQSYLEKLFIEKHDHHVGRRWQRLNLTEFARHFQLTEMEKQAYLLNEVNSTPFLLTITILYMAMVITATIKASIKTKKPAKKK